MSSVDSCIVRACEELEKVIPPDKKKSAPGKITYGPTNKFEPTFWEPAYLWYDKTGPPYYYDWTGDRFFRAQEVSEKICDRSGSTFQKGLDWHCYMPVDYTYIVRQHGTSAQALMRIFHYAPRRYRFECQAAICVVFLRATLLFLGESVFNKVIPNLVVGPSILQTSLKPFITTDVGGAERTATAEFRSRLKKGTHVYIRNWDVSQQGNLNGYAGENAIYCGGDRYFAFPIGFSSEQKLIEGLNAPQNRKQGSTRSASLTAQYTILREDLLIQAKRVVTG